MSKFMLMRRMTFRSTDYSSLLTLVFTTSCIIGIRTKLTTDREVKSNLKAW